MNISKSPREGCCPECGAQAIAGRDHCWLCNRVVSATTNPCPNCGAGRSTVEAVCEACGWSPPPVREELQRRVITQRMRFDEAKTFTLESLFLTMTLIAVCLGVAMLVPGIGILLVILSVPAWIRTVGIRVRGKATGQPMSTSEKILTFFGSIVVVVIIIVASFITFFVMCYVSLGLERPLLIRFGDSGAVTITIGLVGGSSLAVALLLSRALWYRRD